MKQFSLKEYLKDPSRKVVTRDGKPVRIICTDANQVYDDKPGIFPVVALVTGYNNKEIVCNYSEDGLYQESQSCTLDLFFATTTREGWLNLYVVNDGRNFRTEPGAIYATKEEALNNVLGANCVDTVRIEWEE